MFANRLFDHMDRLYGPVGFDAPPAAYPPLNVWEDADAYHIESEIPGLKLDDIHVSVAEGDQLTIAGERKPAAEGNATWLRQECGTGGFARVIRLPAAVDADKVEATYRNGVLELSLPKTERAKWKKIAVRG